MNSVFKPHPIKNPCSPADLNVYSPPTEIKILVSMFKIYILKESFPMNLYLKQCLRTYSTSKQLLVCEFDIEKSFKSFSSKTPGK